jgi:hypothetical protein
MELILEKRFEELCRWIVYILEYRIV